MPLKPVKIKERFENLKKDPKGASNYAINVMKRRWPEAEPIIMKDPKNAIRYAFLLMRGNRWPELEKLIIHDPELIMDYAKNHLMNRWVEAEPNLLKDPHTALKYVSRFGLIWPELEQILKSGYPDLWNRYKEHFKSIYKM